MKPAAVTLPLLQFLPQFYCLTVGYDYLPLSFLIGFPLRFKQMLLLYNGGILFPDGLIGLGKVLKS